MPPYFAVVAVRMSCNLAPFFTVIPRATSPRVDPRAPLPMVVMTSARSAPVTAAMSAAAALTARMSACFVKKRLEISMPARTSSSAMPSAAMLSICLSIATFSPSVRMPRAFRAAFSLSVERSSSSAALTALAPKATSAPATTADAAAMPLKAVMLMFLRLPKPLPMVRRVGVALSIALMTRFMVPLFIVYPFAPGT